MEVCVGAGTHDFTMASRKAEEAALRRFQAVHWLESMVGPIGIPNQPSEREFISCLRNGLILCNVINKIHPGAVPKVVEIQFPLQAYNLEMRPLPAYQYFENVRNFLVAVEELKLPAFEASDIERDTLEAGSAAKVVDCILGLKSYHENGFTKHSKSPFVAHKMNARASVMSTDSFRRLDMTALCEKPPQLEEVDKKKKEEALVQSLAKLLADFVVGTKENIDAKVLSSFRDGNTDLMQLFTKFISGPFGEHLRKKSPEFHSAIEDSMKARNVSPAPSIPELQEDLSLLQDSKQCKACLRRGNCKCRHTKLLKAQERELSDLKALLLNTKEEFEDLQLHLQRDMGNLGMEVKELSSAALGYHKVVKENRALYNLVQDLKGNIRVYCRIRPLFNSRSQNAIDFIGDDGSLVLTDPSKPGKDGRKLFNFNRVFGPSATQDEIFEDTQPLIRSVMDGYNVCIFAYGQTGSGKTYTMSGPGGSNSKTGINYLALNDLFLISSKRKDTISYDIRVQMVEIYNEQVRDLLAEDSSTTKLEIRSCPSDDGLSLPDATTCSVKSTSDVINLIKLGEMNRFVSSTAMNNRSSRSHSVLTVHVHGRDTLGDKLHSCLHLVDLAGSERVDKSEVTGDRLKEAQYINKSLSCLGDVILALAQKNSHIPYRNSKLTLLLQDSLGGNAKTLMFAHVSPEDDSFGETISTLKFAQRASMVELGAARMNKETNEVIQLKQQVENLKKALASKEASKTAMDRTPPRLRRLSIEKEPSFEERKGFKTPSAQNASRRSSLEGPRSFGKENREVSVSVDICKPKMVLEKKCGIQTRDFEATTKSFGDISYGAHASSAKLAKDPRSPTSAVYQKRAKMDRTHVPSALQLPKTPESQIRQHEARSKIQNELTLSTYNPTPNAISCTNGKGSQIKRSLRTTIGKLISGSERRNQSTIESKPIAKIACNIDAGKSPATANGRTLRRQSLTGIEIDRNRRSSLGGKPIEINNARNAKTPPPVRQSTTNFGQRWV